MRDGLLRCAASPASVRSVSCELKWRGLRDGGGRKDLDLDLEGGREGERQKRESAKPFADRYEYFLVARDEGRKGGFISGFHNDPPF